MGVLWIGGVTNINTSPMARPKSMPQNYRAEPSDWSASALSIFSDMGLIRRCCITVVASDSNGERGMTFFEEGCEDVQGEVTLAAGQTYAITADYVGYDYANILIGAIRVGIGWVSDDTGITHAAEVAAAADRAVIFVGRTSDWDIEGSDMRGITLPGAQNRLIEAVAAANPNTVAVLQTGGPVEMPWLSKVRAVLQVW